MPFKFDWMKPKDDAPGELVLSDEQRAKMLEGTASKEDVTALGSKFDALKASLDSINAHFSKEEDEKKAAAAKKARDDAATNATQTEEELNELFLTNPVEATKKLLQLQTNPVNAAVLQVRADTLKRSIFEDEEKYPFYTGEIKAEIDKLLAGESLQAQNNPATIEHAYHSTVGRKYKEISEGKLKSRFASSEGSRGSNGDLSSKKLEDQVKPLDEEGKKAARILGYDTPEKQAQYAKMLHEEGIGAV